MNPADLAVASVIILFVASAILILVRERHRGRTCCGCKSCVRQTRIIEVGDELDRKA